MKKFILFLLGVLLYGQALANNLKIENVQYDPSKLELTFDVSWDNAWYIGNFYQDGVWVFIKYKNANSQQWRPVGIVSSSSGNGGLMVTNFLDGLFIALDKKSSVPTNATDQITLELVPNALDAEFLNPSFKVFGLEMVLIPPGDYYIGDGSDNTLFSDPDNTIDPQASLLMDGTNQEVQVDFLGNLVTMTVDNSYHFALGFYLIMKYEASQQQFVDFLNCLTRQEQDSLLPSLSQGPKFKYPMSQTHSPLRRNGVAYDTSTAAGQQIEFFMDLNDNGIANEEGDGQTIACNYVTLRQFLSYMDFAHLRPMSAFEYEKAARGFDLPIAQEAAWGTTGKTIITDAQIQNPGQNNEGVSITGPGLSNLNAEGPLRVGFGATSNSSRLESGGSYFGVMNLSDNVSEWCHLSLLDTRDISSYQPGDGIVNLTSLDFFSLNFQLGSALFSKGGNYLNNPDDAAISAKPPNDVILIYDPFSQSEADRLNNEKATQPTMGIRGVR